MTVFPRRRFLIAGSVSALLAGCGFRLRGPQRFDFSTIYVGVPAMSDLGRILRREIALSGSTTVVEDPAQAQVRLDIIDEKRDREILSLTGAGKVREYLITYLIRFQLKGPQETLLLAPVTLHARRDYTFNDEQILGKEQEEALLYRDMLDDLVQQLLRRLASVRMG